MKRIIFVLVALMTIGFVAAQEQSCEQIYCDQNDYWECERSGCGHCDDPYEGSCTPPPACDMIKCDIQTGYGLVYGDGLGPIPAAEEGGFLYCSNLNSECDYCHAPPEGQEGNWQWNDYQWNQGVQEAYGYCAPMTGETVPEFSTIGIVALIIVGLVAAMFVFVKKQ